MDFEEQRERHGTLAVWLALAGMALLLGYNLLVPRPEKPMPIVDGRYESARCGSLTIRNGEMRLGGQAAKFTLGRDKAGVHAIGAHFIGVAIPASQPCRLVVDRSKHPMKMRFYPADAPTQIEIWDDRVTGPHVFVRAT